MTSSRTSPTVLGLSLAALMLSLPAAAQQVIRISNTTPTPRDIPLEANSSVQIDANGNLVAQCALTNGVCTALSSGGGQTGTVTATLTRTDAATTVTAGSSIVLQWTSTNADVCAGTVGAGTPATSWAGPKATAGTGVSLLMSATGNYEIKLRCYNASGASAEQTVSVTVEAGQSQPTNCTITDPLIAPSFMGRIDKSWSATFSSPNGQFIGTYPTSPAGVVPIGSDKGKYTVVPFQTPSSGTHNVVITFDQAQSNNGYGYPTPHVTNGGMFMSISPCPGDLRAIDNTAAHGSFLKGNCRVFANSGGLIYSTTVIAGTVCKLDPGQTYYLNISPVNPSNGITPGEETCENPLFADCHVQATSRAQ